MTYSHTRGVRDDLADFSGAILDDNKAAGLMTLLEGGVPKVNGLNDLAGLTIIDVGGWAPTADGLSFVTNKCTGQGYSANLTVVVGDGNDAAMSMLRNGAGDAVFLYADQGHRFQCASDGTAATDGIAVTWDCSLWAGLGTDYAYVQTGQKGYALNGTTLALAKKGSSAPALIDSCLASFMQTKDYYDICVKHGMVDDCYPNSFFPDANSGKGSYDMETNALTTECSTGYCKCPSTSSVTLKIGQDDNYPPYAYRNATTGELAGFGKDIADGLTATCTDLTIEVVHANWSDCWSSAGGGALGGKIVDGTLDACMTYSHTRGVRDDLADFSGAILDDNKAAGLMTLLEGGVPKVNGLNDLAGLTIIDVGGWAPTADGLSFVTNKCTGQGYSANLTVVVGDGNDAAMSMLRNGAGDAVFLYADQGHRFQCASDGTAATDGIAVTWDCSLWAGLGTDYAYVQTGQKGYALNGTTLALAKKGSSAPALIDSCLASFMQTKDYYDICVKHGMVDDCYPNSFFPDANSGKGSYDMETNALTTECSTGYCKCPITDTTTSGAGALILGLGSGMCVVLAILAHGSQ